jgi:hypothetical protein
MGGRMTRAAGGPRAIGRRSLRGSASNERLRFDMTQISQLVARQSILDGLSQRLATALTLNVRSAIVRLAFERRGAS